MTFVMFSSSVVFNVVPICVVRRWDKVVYRNAVMGLAVVCLAIGGTCSHEFNAPSSELFFSAYSGMLKFAYAEVVPSTTTGAAFSNH